MATQEILDKLEEMAKRKCKITWSDDNTDEIVKEMVQEANEIIKSKVGLPDDTDPEIFLKPGVKRMLWKEYCLYRWNDDTDEFDKRYLREIMQARRECEVEQFEKKRQVQ